MQLVDQGIKGRAFQSQKYPIWNCEIHSFPFPAQAECPYFSADLILG